MSGAPWNTQSRAPHISPGASSARSCFGRIAARSRGRGRASPPQTTAAWRGVGQPKRGVWIWQRRPTGASRCESSFRRWMARRPGWFFFFCSESVPHFLRGDRRPHCTCRSLRVPASAQTPAQHPHPSSDSLLIQLLINPVMTLNPVLAVHCLRCSTSAATPMPRRGS